MPILGVIASSRRAGDQGAMFALQSIVLTTPTTSSITFRDIPSTYSHLQIRCFSRTDKAANSANLNFVFNQDTGNVMTDHYMIAGNGGTGAGGSGYSGAISYAGTSVASSTLANTYAISIVDILDYANTNKFKTIRGHSGWDANGTGGVTFRSSLWSKTNAITSVTISSDGGNLVSGSQYALYGIKGA